MSAKHDPLEERWNLFFSQQTLSPYSPSLYSRPPAYLPTHAWGEPHRPKVSQDLKSTKMRSNITGKSLPTWTHLNSHVSFTPNPDSTKVSQNVGSKKLHRWRETEKKNITEGFPGSNRVPALTMSSSSCDGSMILKTICPHCYMVRSAAVQKTPTACHFSLRCLWKRRKGALEQSVVQAWWDICSLLSLSFPPFFLPVKSQVKMLPTPEEMSPHWCVTPREMSSPSDFVTPAHKCHPLWLVTHHLTGHPPWMSPPPHGISAASARRWWLWPLWPNLYEIRTPLFSGSHGCTII